MATLNKDAYPLLSRFWNMYVPIKLSNTWYLNIYRKIWAYIKWLEISRYIFGVCVHHWFQLHFTLTLRSLSIFICTSTWYFQGHHWSIFAKTVFLHSINKCIWNFKYRTNISKATKNLRKTYSNLYILESEINLHLYV